MLNAIKPVCFRPRTDGTSNIHIQYYYNNEKTLLDTKIVIPVKYWDKVNLQILSDLPPISDTAVNLNANLQIQMRLVEDTITYAVKKNIENKDEF